MNPLLESNEESQSVSTLFVNNLGTFLFRCTFSHVISVSVLQLQFNWLMDSLYSTFDEWDWRGPYQFLIRWLFLLLRVSPSFSGIKSSSLHIDFYSSPIYESVGHCWVWFTSLPFASRPRYNASAWFIGSLLFDQKNHRRRWNRKEGGESE